MDVDAVFDAANKLFADSWPLLSMIFAVWTGFVITQRIARVIVESLLSSYNVKPKNDAKRKNDEIVHCGDVLTVVDTPETGEL